MVVAQPAFEIKQRIINNCTRNSKTNCLEWNGYKDKDGYGLISIKKKTYRLHRIIYSFYSKLESHLHVLHTCDNPSCIEINHLKLGSNLDNVLDKISKGRQPKGCNHSNSKLTSIEVEAIKNYPNSYGVCTKLSKIYNIATTNISKIRRGISYNG